MLGTLFTLPMFFTIVLQIRFVGIPLSPQGMHVNSLEDFIWAFRKDMEMVPWPFQLYSMGSFI